MLQLVELVEGGDVLEPESAGEIDHPDAGLNQLGHQLERGFRRRRQQNRGALARQIERLCLRRVAELRGGADEAHPPARGVALPAVARQELELDVGMAGENPRGLDPGVAGGADHADGGALHDDAYLCNAGPTASEISAGSGFS